MDIAQLGYQIDSSQLKVATADLGKMTQAAGKAESGFDRMAKKVQGDAARVRSAVAGIAAAAGVAFSAAALVGFTRGLSRVADEYANIQAKIRLVTSDYNQLATASQAVFDISQRTYSSLNSTATLVSRTTRALVSNGQSAEAALSKSLALTETIQKAFAVSGATAEEANSAIIQLSQGLAAGALRGEEFNSVAEQGSRITQALSAYLKMTTGELRAFAFEGKLTAEIVQNALEAQAATIQAEFDKLPLTISRATQVMSNAWMKFIGDMDQASGTSRTVAEAIALVGRNLDSIVSAAGTAASAIALVFGGRAISSITAYVAGLVSQVTATRAAQREAVTLAQTEVADARATEAATAAHLAKLQAMRASGLAVKELTAAEAAYAAAQTRSAAAATALATAQAANVGIIARLAGAGSALFTALGGWVTVGLAAAAALYKLGDALIKGSASAQEAISRVEGITQSMRSMREQAELVKSGVPEALTATAQAAKALVDEIKAAEESIDSLSAADFTSIGAAWKFINNEIERRSISKATEELNNLTDELVWATLEAEDFGAAYEANRKILVAAGAPTEMFDKALAGLAVTFGKTANAARDAAVGLKTFTDAEQQAIGKAVGSAYRAGLSEEDLIRYNALLESFKVESQEARDIIMSAAEAEIAAKRARDASAESVRDSTVAIDDQNDSLAEYQRLLNDSATEQAEWIANQQAMREEAVRFVSSLQDDYETALRLGSMSVEQRRIEIAVMDAQRDAAGRLGDAYNENIANGIRNTVTAGESLLIQQEQMREQVEETTRAWEDFAYGMADAVLEGSGGVKRYFKRLLDDLKRELIASGLLKLFRSMFNIGGGSGGGGFWGALLGVGASVVSGGAAGASGGAATGNVVQGSSIWGQVASAALGGSGSGGGLNIFNAASWVNAGKNLWSGFQGMLFGSGQTTALGSMLGTAQFGPGMATTWAPTGLGMAGLAAGGLAGAYYGFTNRGGSNGSGGSIAAGLSYGALGLGAAGAAMGVASGAGAVAGATGAFSALGGAAAIPVIGWIAAIAAIVDMISGGRLFGTRFRPEEATATIGVGAEGAFAEAELREVRQRSLFRGRQWRTRQIEPGEEAIAAAEALYLAVEDVMVSSARRLRGTAPEMIDAAIRTVQEFDSKGRVKATKLFVDILGRSWEAADADEAAQRIAAEAMIATIDGILGYRVAAAGVLPPGTTLPPGTNPGGPGGPGGGPGGDNTPPWLRPPGDVAPKALATLAAVASVQSETQQMIGEASSIAERWRSDVEQLTIGATFLLQVASDMRSGFALLGEGPGSLTAVTDLVEELAYGGESLIDTYSRIAASTGLLEQALGMMGLALESEREAFVRFAVDIAEAAGGVERAGMLWNDFFNRFYTAEERAIYALSQAELGAGREFGDIGLNFADFRDPEAGGRFREMFEELLPSLSADAIVQWLEAANALGIVIDAELALAQARGNVAEVTEQIARDAEGIAAALAELAREDMLAGLDEYSRRMAEIGFQFDDYRAQLVGMGATVEELAQLEEYRTNALERARAEMQAQINEMLVSNYIEQMTSGLSEYNAAAVEVIRSFDSQRAQMIELGASSAQLTALELQRADALARVAQQVEASSRALIDQLGYSALGMIERQIAELESSATVAADATAGVATGLREITSAAQQFRDSIMVDSRLSGMSIADQYTEALRQLRETGDSGTARRALELARELNASGSDYRSQRDMILSLVRDTQTAVGSSPAAGGGVSPELAALYAERDRLRAAQEAADRLDTATTLLRNLADLSRVGGDGVLDVAGRLGLADMNRFAADLGLASVSDIESLAAGYLAFDPLTMISAGDQAIIDTILQTSGPITNPGFVVDPNNPDPGGKSAEQDSQDVMIELLNRVAERLDELVPMAASTGDSTVGLLRRIADNATDPTLKPRVAVPNG